MIDFAITVRDGRIGRDPDLVTEEGGEVLMVLHRVRPVVKGEQLTLPDGTDVRVIGSGKPRGRDGVGTQTVHVGDLFDV
jgi:hypothetical protein